MEKAFCVGVCFHHLSAPAFRMGALSLGCIHVGGLVMAHIPGRTCISAAWVVSNSRVMLGFAKFSAHILRSYIQMQHEMFSFATLFFYERNNCEVEIEKVAALRRCCNHFHEIVHAVGPLLIPYSVMSIGISVTHSREASGASAEASSGRSPIVWCAHTMQRGPEQLGPSGISRALHQQVP